MISQTCIDICIGPRTHDCGHDNESEVVSLEIPLHCPFCEVVHENVGDWGWYYTTTGNVRRFHCRECEKTFNPVKIPYWTEKVAEIIWKLAQLVIEDRMTINSIARMYNVPESTLRRLATEIKTLLAENFEYAKQIHEQLAGVKKKPRGGLRYLFYDEGFMKLLGVNAFMIFTVDGDGRPITLAIEARRDGETVHGHFLQAATQLGGIDVIVADGARAILAAAKALRQDLVVIQQIHAGKAKRVRITKYEKIPEKKFLRETTIELRAGSLLPGIESIITAKKKKVYPPKYPVNSKVHEKTKKKSTVDGTPVERTGTLTPVEGVDGKKKAKKSRPRLLKGYQAVLHVGTHLNELELNYIPEMADQDAPECPTLVEIHGMLAIVQAILPDQFITSNRAEVFNALHDRSNNYWGLKNLSHADRDVRAWATMKFYTEGARVLIQRYQWRLPYRLFKQLWFLMISGVNIG